MQHRSGARELGLAVALLAALSRFVEGEHLPAAAALIVVVGVSGSARLGGDHGPDRWLPDRLILPGLAAFAGVGIARLVDPVPWLAAVFAGTWLVVAWATSVESDPPRALSDGSHARPVAVRLGAFGLAFGAFAAVGGLVPGSIPGGGRQPEMATSLAALALLVVAGSLAGARIAAVRPHGAGHVFVAFCQYAMVLVPAGIMVWVLGLPRLFGPALLLLATYLATSMRESEEPLRSNTRLLEETAALVLAGLGVIALGLLTRQW
jgi:hypothetical protein